MNMINLSNPIYIKTDYKFSSLLIHQKKKSQKRNILTTSVWQYLAGRQSGRVE